MAVRQHVYILQSIHAEQSLTKNDRKETDLSKQKVKGARFSLFRKVIKGSTDNISENGSCFTHAADDDVWFTRKNKHFHIRMSNRRFPTG